MEPQTLDGSRLVTVHSDGELQSALHEYELKDSDGAIIINYNPLTGRKVVVIKIYGEFEEEARHHLAELGVSTRQIRKIQT